jgi:archaellum biogenesis protein FlaJ (TadC family)
MQKKKDGMKKMLSNLGNLGELYVSLLIVAPILFILILTILSILGSPSSGGSVLQLNLLTFMGIPLLATGFIIILDVIMGGIE